MVMFYVGKMVLFSKINHFVVYMFSFALPPLLRRDLNGVGLVTSVCVCLFSGLDMYKFNCNIEKNISLGPF